MKAIHTPEDHAAALAAAKALWGNDEQAGELEAWLILIEDYEAKLIKPAHLDPIEVLKAEMDMAGRSAGDLGRLIGPTRVSDILQRRRRLTVAMIRDISREWQVPADLLIGDYRVEAKTELRRPSPRSTRRRKSGRAAA